MDLTFLTLNGIYWLKKLPQPRGLCCLRDMGGRPTLQPGIGHGGYPSTGSGSRGMEAGDRDAEESESY